MNTDSRSDTHEQHIDAALAGLPEWRPTKDFTTRLSAAAARQAAAAAQSVPEPAWAMALEHLNRWTPLVLWSAALAAVLAWVMPWSQLAGGMELVWTSVAIMAVAGIALVRRVLRAP